MSLVTIRTFVREPNNGKAKPGSGFNVITGATPPTAKVPLAGEIDNQGSVKDACQPIGPADEFEIENDWEKLVKAAPKATWVMTPSRGAMRKGSTGGFSRASISPDDDGEPHPVQRS